MTRHLVWYCAAQLFGATLLVAASATGLIETVVEADSSRIVFLIGGIFVLCLAYSVWCAIRAPCDKTTLSPITFCSGLLPVLGMIGTVWGFIIALSGVSPETAGDVSQVTGMVAKLVSGMHIALYTTLAGMVLGTWLSLIRWILEDSHG